MTEVRFYHLTRANLESALPVMLRRVLERGQKAQVQATSQERVEQLAHHLWVYDDASFLPHGSAQDGRPEAHPIYLTPEDETARNGAQVLFLVDGAISDRLSHYDLCAVLFDGSNDEALGASREYWRQLKEAGHDLSYWQQDDGGRWEQKA